MRRLLKNNELRRLELVERLSNSHSWMTIEEIAKALNCSPRVVKNDVVILRDYSDSFNIESSYQGIRLTFDPQHTIKIFYRQVLENSTAFKILELIFFNDGITSEEIQEAPDTFDALSYDAAGSDEPEAIRQALETVSYEGVTDFLEYDEFHGAFNTAPMLQYENGEVIKTFEVEGN